MQVIFAILVAAVIVGAYLLISRFLSQEKASSDLTQRLHSEDQIDFQQPFYEEEDEQTQQVSARAASMQPIIDGMIGATGGDADSTYKKIRKKLLYAGIRSADAPIYYLAYQFIASPVLILIGLSFFWGIGDSQRPLEDGVIGVLVLLIGGFGHRLYVKNRTEKRQKEIIRSFPDMLDLLLVCVESGLALDAALARVCEELGRAHPLLTEELNRTRMELSVVSDRSKALYSLGERNNTIALKTLAAALIQSEKFGTSLGDTLRVISDDYRQTRLLLAEEKAAKLPALITIPLVTMLLPAMFIVILAPAILGVMSQGGLFGNG